ncbi:MAG TPA: EAL domain-containing protein [Pseudoneobacillus sp.]|nr:EAL domain-containing protein [Pseudoneobacillus sp.]
MENGSKYLKKQQIKLISFTSVLLLLSLFILQIIEKVINKSFNIWIELLEYVLIVIFIQLIMYFLLQRPYRKYGRIAWLGFFYNDAERMFMEEKLAENEKKYRALFENNMDSAFVLDENGRFVEVNKMGSVVTGYTMEELIGQPFMPYVPDDELPIVLKWFEKILNGESVRFETKWTHKKGHQVEVDVTAMPIFQNNKTIGAFCFTRDITEQKRYQQEIKDLAYKDPLTRLSNRRFFLEELNKKLNKAKNEEEKLAVMYLDLDSLKLINDHLGHQAGDIVLKQVGEKLLQSIEKNETIARIGGDEFGIIIPNVDGENTVSCFAKKILSTLEEGFSLGNNNVQCGASIGIVFYPDHGEDAELLIKHADIAMYAVKKSGKNNFKIYDQGLNTRSKDGFQLQQDLGRALLENQFFLEYQPRIDSETKKVVAVEALLRWNHPVKGLISPQIFIPLAEENGFIIKLGEWVLTKACKQLKEWQNNGVDSLRMAVNVSAKQFERGNIFIIVERTLKEWNIEPTNLEIEITESTLMNEDESTLASIHALHRKGVHFSIDDFGKGYSSLSYLKNFKINTIKIDKAFVQNVHDNHENASITQAIVSLAHSMNLRVCAEGVEHKEEMDYLIDSMVDELQGYYISHPLPAEQVYNYVINNNS